MVDVLLAHSFFLKNDSRQVEKMRPYPPLGTLYAASHLRMRGYEVALFDAMLSEGIHEFEKILTCARPKVVAFYEDQFHFLNKMCLNHSRQALCRMSEISRAQGAKVIASGSDLSDHPEAYFRHGVEYVLSGEADHTLIELVNVLTGRSQQAVESIEGLAMPETSDPTGVRKTNARLPERHPDSFPFPAWDLLDAEKYREVWRAAHGYFSVNMVSTRGCPFHCNWCAKPIWGQRYAMRSPANVAEEMALIKQTIQPDHVWFADDIFGLQPKWVAEFAREVAARDASIPFMIQSRVDLMTDQAVEALARAGCAEVWLGAESGSQRILDAMDKGTRVSDIPTVREKLRRAGIRACFFIQFGYPGETIAEIMETVRMVRECLPDDIGVSVSNPLPGTRFHEMVKDDLGEKDHWEESNDLAMMFQGTYRTEFYRALHKLLHRDLEMRHRLARNPGCEDTRAAMEALEAQWDALIATEANHRSANPTPFRKKYDLIEAPDLSRRWN
jgi:anaerobic magnesium-protoporphyrin IX monomethyl ester cyclase